MVLKQYKQLQTTQIVSDICFITGHIAYASSNKTKIVVSNETELLFFFSPGVEASHVYVRAWALGCFHKTVSTDHSFCRERRAEADSNRGPSAYQPNALPLGETGSQGCRKPCSAWSLPPECSASVLTWPNLPTSLCVTQTTPTV